MKQFACDSSQNYQNVNFLLDYTFFMTVALVLYRIGVIFYLRENKTNTFFILTQINYKSCIDPKTIISLNQMPYCILKQINQSIKFYYIQTLNELNYHQNFRAIKQQNSIIIQQQTTDTMGNSQPNYIQIDPTQYAKLIDQTEKYKVYQNFRGQQFQKYDIKKIQNDHEFQKKYQYRIQNRSKQLVQVLYAGKSLVTQAQKKNTFICNEQANYEVVTERIKYRLKDLQQLNFQNALTITRTALKGYKQIYSHKGILLVTDQMIGINNEDQVKVWMNCNFALNYIQQIPISLKAVQPQHLQDILVNNIIDLINSKTVQSKQWKQLMITKSNFRNIKFDNTLQIVYGLSRKYRLKDINLVFDVFNKEIYQNLNNQVYHNYNYGQSSYYYQGGNNPNNNSNTNNNNNNHAQGLNNGAINKNMLLYRNQAFSHIKPRIVETPIVSRQEINRNYFNMENTNVNVNANISYSRNRNHVVNQQRSSSPINMFDHQQFQRTVLNSNTNQNIINSNSPNHNNSMINSPRYIMKQANLQNNSGYHLYSHQQPLIRNSSRQQFIPIQKVNSKPVIQTKLIKSSNHLNQEYYHIVNPNQQPQPPLQSQPQPQRPSQKQMQSETIKKQAQLIIKQANTPYIQKQSNNNQYQNSNDPNNTIKERLSQISVYQSSNKRLQQNLGSIEADQSKVNINVQFQDGSPLRTTPHLKKTTSVSNNQQAVRNTIAVNQQPIRSTLPQVNQARVPNHMLSSTPVNNQNMIRSNSSMNNFRPMVVKFNNRQVSLNHSSQHNSQNIRQYIPQPQLQPQSKNQLVGNSFQPATNPPNIMLASTYHKQPLQSTTLRHGQQSIQIKVNYAPSEASLSQDEAINRLTAQLQSQLVQEINQSNRSSSKNQNFSKRSVQKQKQKDNQIRQSQNHNKNQEQNQFYNFQIKNQNKSQKNEMNTIRNTNTNMNLTETRKIDNKKSYETDANANFSPYNSNNYNNNVTNSKQAQHQNIKTSVQKSQISNSTISYKDLRQLLASDI